MTPTTGRAAYTDGLRKIADLIDEHPELPLPFYGADGNSLSWFVYDTAHLALLLDAMEGQRHKDYGTYFADVKGHVAGVLVEAHIPREQVCERRVVGTETVELPDPEALAAVPKIAVERDVVEWTCHPILAGVAERSDVPA